MSAPVAPIRANNFADLRLKLDAAYWAERTGVIASECLLFVQGEITYRQATAALVAEMAPPTRWEAQK